MRSSISAAIAMSGVLSFGVLRASGIVVQTVPIGFAGNTPDPTTGRGAVPYTYEIGATEVTNAQYAAFLNAVAATDTFGLYNATSRITRAGSPGSYVYSVNAFGQNRPVEFTTFQNAARFVNWLQNGQPTGAQDVTTTEDGAYTLTSGTIVRNPGTQWALPNEAEWYKAAYFQPEASGGDSDSYWLYPNSKNTLTTAEACLNGSAGFGIPLPVGSYAPNFFGVFDMAGNVSEWNESIDPVTPSKRQHRGGAANDLVSFTASTFSLTWFIDRPHVDIGFRVVRVPTPSGAAVVGAGMIASLLRPQRRQRS